MCQLTLSITHTKDFSELVFTPRQLFSNTASGYVLMNDGSSINSNGQSETGSDGESASSSRRLSLSRRPTNVKTSEQDTSDDAFVNRETEDEHYPPRSGESATVEDELSRLRAGRKLHINRFLDEGYRNVLNSMIEEVIGNSDQGFQPESSSQIGASFWTGHEKEVFFRTLTSKPQRNLRTIAQFIGTKNEAEVQYYLTLLSSPADQSVSTTLHSICPSQIPAAFEISSDCEEILDVAARELARQLHKQAVVAEHSSHGDMWLVDEDTADYIEDQYEASAQSHQSVNDWSASDIPRALSEPGTVNPSDMDQGRVWATRATTEPVPTKDKSSIVSKGNLSPSETLLRPVAFLQLSRDLFMNHGRDDDLNWQSLTPISDVAESPAMFATAFADLYNITVGLTRKLVQTALFQATSRLRAEDVLRDAQPPAAIVRDVDVRTAIHVLGMETDREAYWAKVARRCQVNVFSRSEAYADGRPGTKAGYTLTYDEVESALNRASEKPIASVHDPEPGPIHDVDVWDAIHNEDLDILTDPDTSDTGPSSSLSPSSSPSSPLSTSASDDDSESESVISQHSPNPRKRNRNPEFNHYRETRFLDSLDHQASLNEEDRLWKALRLQPPSRSSPERKSYDPPEFRSADHGVNYSQSNWRDRLEYEAEWERPEPLIKPEAFVEMEVRGRRARKRRKLLYDRIEERLERGSDTEDEGESTDNDDDANGDNGEEGEVWDGFGDASESDRGEDRADGGGSGGHSSDKDSDSTSREESEVESEAQED